MDLHVLPWCLVIVTLWRVSYGSYVILSGCLLSKQAVCCDDKTHCCPEGTSCDIEHSKCISSSTKKDMPMWAKFPARMRAEWENKKGQICFCLLVQPYFTSSFKIYHGLKLNVRSCSLICVAFHFQKVNMLQHGQFTMAALKKSLKSPQWMQFLLQRRKCPCHLLLRQLQVSCWDAKFLIDVSVRFRCFDPQ